MKTEEQKEKNRIASRKWYQLNKARHKNSMRKWNNEHRIERNEMTMKYHNKNKERLTKYQQKWSSTRRKSGLTQYCTYDYELIENYELAKADNFDPKLWHLHHRDENEYSRKWLIEHDQYYKLAPDKLIWLPADEHRSDYSLSRLHPELSKWHQRVCEINN